MTVITITSLVSSGGSIKFSYAEDKAKGIVVWVGFSITTTYERQGYALKRGATIKGSASYTYYTIRHHHALQEVTARKRLCSQALHTAGYHNMGVPASVLLKHTVHNIEVGWIVWLLRFCGLFGRISLKRCALHRLGCGGFWCRGDIVCRVNSLSLIVLSLRLRLWLYRGGRFRLWCLLRLKQALCKALRLGCALAN